MSDVFSDNQFRGTLGGSRPYFTVSGAAVPYQNYSALQNALGAMLGQNQQAATPQAAAAQPDPTPTETTTVAATPEPVAATPVTEPTQPVAAPAPPPQHKPFSLGGYVPPSYFGGSSI